MDLPISQSSVSRETVKAFGVGTVVAGVGQDGVHNLGMRCPTISTKGTNGGSDWSSNMGPWVFPSVKVAESFVPRRNDLGL